MTRNCVHISRLSALLCFLSFSTLAQTFQMHNGDTINLTDANNMKQGKWVYFGKTKDDPAYKPDQIVETGAFDSNRKVGVWTKYFPNGKAQSEITYEGGRPNGSYKIYYDNGQLQEEGVWKNNRNVEEFRRFYENGQPQQEFNFTGDGKREGKQRYFHDNGQVMIEGDWSGGKESGELKEYYSNGEVKSVKYFNNGAIDAAKTKTFEPKSAEVAVQKDPEPVEAKAAPKVTSDEQVNLGVFNGTGNHTMYNKNKQISKKGYFEGGRLKEGKVYRYDENGILVSIEVYKAFKYVGEGVIEDEK